MAVGPHAKKSHKRARAVANRRSAFTLGVVRAPMSTHLPQVDGYAAWGYSGQLTGDDCAIVVAPDTDRRCPEWPWISTSPGHRE